MSWLAGIAVDSPLITRYADLDMLLESDTGADETFSTSQYPPMRLFQRPFSSQTVSDAMTPRTTKEIATYFEEDERKATA